MRCCQCELRIFLFSLLYSDIGGGQKRSLKNLWLILMDWNNDQWSVKTGGNWRILVSVWVKLDHRPPPPPLSPLNSNDIKSWFTIKTGLIPLSSVKTYYFKKILNILFWNWKHWTAIIKWVNFNFISKRPHSIILSLFFGIVTNLTVVAVINCLLGMQIWKAHGSQTHSFGCCIILLIIWIL